MSSVRYTRNLFLRGLCIVYMFSFLSLYLQIPGLFGNNGILPAKLHLDNVKGNTLLDQFKAKPTLLWGASHIGLDVQYMMEILALLGTLVAFLGFVSQKICTKLTYFILWVFYYSIYQVGQNFTNYLTDDLLLEAGFLAFVVAPLFSQSRPKKNSTSKSDEITMWLIRWLLFRVLFSTGISKLLSGTPKWWDLSAMSIHFEAIPLPTPLAWYCHHLPKGYLKLVTIYSQITETILPFLFFIPIRGVRIVAFLNQLFLQLNILMTGNFNTYNFLMVTLLVSLLDDQVFYRRSNRKRATKWRRLFEFLLNIAIHGTVLYGCYLFYGMNIEGNTFESKIMFSKRQFEDVAIKLIVVSTLVGLVSLSFTIFTVIVELGRGISQGKRPLRTLFIPVFCSLLAITIFAFSTIPIYGLHPTANQTKNADLYEHFKKIEHLKLFNKYNYNTFKSLNSDYGRPEIIIEGSDDIEGPWQEYNFLYKPGNVNNSLPFVAPYSPRLDWQIWLASSDTYHAHPWLLAFAYRILTGQPEVLQLLDRDRLPFHQNKPPKYMRALLYNYHYTLWDQRWQSSWWTRQNVGEYLPVYSKDNVALLDFLRSQKLIPANSKEVVSTAHPLIRLILDQIRNFITQIEGSFFLWSVFATGCAIIATRSASSAHTRK